MRTHELNLNNPFIRGYYIDPKLCDEIIAASEDTQDKFVAGIKAYKNAALTICNSSIQQRYLNELTSVLEEYKKEFPAVNDKLAAWTLYPEIRIQRYDAGQFYKEYHAEQCGEQWNITRHLAFMTYLHDMQDEGGTEFFHQQLKVKPEQGLTIIWPADWTHLHRGIVSNTEVKYILTGWFVFDTSRWK
mgnify:CR=1 FL=1